MDEDIPGRVGEAMATMGRDLQVFITRLEVFNRILRHNLRNQLDVINSHAEALEDPEHREEILTATEKLNRLGARARRIDHLMSKDPEPTTIDLTDRIEAVLDEIESEDTAVTMSVPDDPTVVSDPEILTTVLRSPLENAVAFADTVGCDSMEIFATPGWRIPPRTYSRQY